MALMGMMNQRFGKWRRWMRVPPILWVVLIMLVAVLLRVYGVYRISPPGLEHDEVANWLIDRAILDGNIAIYYPQAYGHEAGFHYIQALSVALLGNHALALRLPAVFSGLLLIAVQYALARRLFDFPVALIAAALLAVLFWPIFYSRLGLRAILLPTVSGVSLYCWWRGWDMKRPAKGGRIFSNWKISPSFWFFLAGMFAGLTLYTYMAARAVPIFYGLFLLYLFLLHRSRLKQHWRGLLIFIIFFAVVAAPLIIYLRANPGAEFRVSEIDAPLQALWAGDLKPTLQNSIKVLGMFGIQGDPLWRQNVANRPVFGPLLALLFYVGNLLALWRWRDARYAFLLLWLGSAAIPSIVTIDAPSSIRMINTLLVITVFPALVIHNIARFSTIVPKLSTDWAYLLALMLLGTHIWWTVIGIFHIWPQNEEVQFVWQVALTETAAYLDRANDSSPVAVGGWSPATLDPSTMALSMRRRDLDLRFFGSDSTTKPITTLIIPQAREGDRVRLTRPTIRDLTPELESQLATWGATPQVNENFVLYELTTPLQIDPQVKVPANFGDQLSFIGYSFPEDQQTCAAEPCRLLTYWHVTAPAASPLSFFLHAVDEAGKIIAQDDRLDAPARSWRVGDVLVQAHTLHLNHAEPAALRLGVYDPQTGRRLLLADGADHILFAFP